jgi:transcriptional regulator with XRE-family HTH domain
MPARSAGDQSEVKCRAFRRAKSGGIKHFVFMFGRMQKMGGSDHMSAEDAVLEAVSMNLSRLRKSRGWTYDALATRSTVSKGMLVEIEKGRANPSIAILCRLANALGVTMSELLTYDSQKKARLVYHKRDAGKVCWETKSGNESLLIDAARLMDVGIEVWRWRLAPHEHFDGAAHPPGTFEFLYVLRGTLTVLSCGESMSAGPGGTLRLTADAPHRYANEHAKLCEFHMVVAEPVV